MIVVFLSLSTSSGKETGWYRKSDLVFYLLQKQSSFNKRWTDPILQNKILLLHNSKDCCRTSNAVNRCTTAWIWSHMVISHLFWRDGLFWGCSSSVGGTFLLPDAILNLSLLNCNSLLYHNWVKDNVLAGCYTQGVLSPIYLPFPFEDKFPQKHQRKLVTIVSFLKDLLSSSLYFKGVMVIIPGVLCCLLCLPHSISPGLRSCIVCDAKD